MKIYNGMLAAAVMTAAASAAMQDIGAEPTPRRDRHAQRLKVEPTEHTRSKKKSASLSKLLRK